MADVNLHIDDFLEIRYLEEKINTNDITIMSDQAFDSYEIQDKKYIFDPQDTGNYTISYNNNTVSVKVHNILPIDDFNDGNLNEYEDYANVRGGVSDASVVSESQSEVPDQKSVSVYTTSKESGIHAPEGYSSINYPELGDNFYGYLYPKSGQDIVFSWCRTNSSEDSIGYYIDISPDRNLWSVIQGANYYTNVSSSDQETENVTLYGNWYKAEVITDSSEIYVNLKDVTGNTNPSSLTLDLSKVSNKPESGGISFYANQNNANRNLRFNGFKINNGLTK